MRVAIAGGGIGGLAAALALAQRGFSVDVYERAAGPTEVGAGIQISPNGAFALESMGLGAALQTIAVLPARVAMRRWQDDSLIHEVPLGETVLGRYGCIYANVLRFDLVRILSDELSRYRGVDVHYGQSVASVDIDDNGASLHRDDGSVVRADIVVGADGIRSAVRSAIHGQMPSRFSGAVAYRALVPREQVSHLAVEVTNRMGPDAHIVSYFVGQDAKWLNLVCVVPESSWQVESWTEIGSTAELRAAFRGWSDPVHEILDCVVDPVYRWALHDREPLEKWGRGCVTLLGDACHPMLPFMAQGACQALEDAVDLASRLAPMAESGDVTEVPAALRRYEDARRPRTSRVQHLSVRNRDLYHLPDGPEQVARDAGFRSSGDPLAPFGWLYAHRAGTGQ